MGKSEAPDARGRTEPLATNATKPLAFKACEQEWDGYNKSHPRITLHYVPHLSQVVLSIDIVDVSLNCCNRDIRACITQQCPCGQSWYLLCEDSQGLSTQDSSPASRKRNCKSALDGTICVNEC